MDFSDFDRLPKRTPTLIILDQSDHEPGKFDAAAASSENPARQNPISSDPTDTHGVVFHDLDQIAHTIRADRTDRGWSVRDLAEKAGVTQKSIRECEKGTVIPINSLQNLFDALGIYDLALPKEYA